MNKILGYQEISESQHVSVDPKKVADNFEKVCVAWKVVLSNRVVGCVGFFITILTSVGERKKLLYANILPDCQLSDAVLDSVDNGIRRAVNPTILTAATYVEPSIDPRVALHNAVKKLTPRHQNLSGF